jgi:hypothetical protein
MFIHKLNYLDTETAIADLIAKGVYIETEEGLAYANGTQAVVYIGQIVKVQGTYDQDGNVITEPIYFDGVFYDVMTTDIIDFTPNEVFPVNCVHSFAGYPQNAEGNIEINTTTP